MAGHEFFLACSLSTFLYGIMSIHVHFDYVCVCASMYGLGVCIWACAGYVLRLQHLNGEWTPMHDFGKLSLLVWCNPLT